jgi:hypothetical protein
MDFGHFLFLRQLGRRPQEYGRLGIHSEESMSWSGTYSHEFLLALDLWAAAVLFNRPGITISTMSGLVRDGRDRPLALHEWQRAFLRWLEPRLSRAHVEKAKAADIARAKLALEIMGVTS